MTNEKPIRTVTFNHENELSDDDICRIFMGMSKAKFIEDVLNDTTGKYDIYEDTEE